jgi:hypothetical protein
MRLADEQGSKESKVKELEDKLAEMEKKVKNADVLKKQAKNANDEYMRLADKYNALEVSVVRTPQKYLRYLYISM